MQVSRILSHAIIFIATAFSVLNFLPLDGPARHIDTPWIQVASACMWEGLSPYNTSHFAHCWEQVLGREYFAPFVFGPSLLFMAWPLPLFEQKTAYLLVDGANVLALFGLALAFWRIAEMDTVAGWLQVARSVWLGFGLSVGAIAGAAYTGQPVLFVSLGLALAYLGWRTDRAIPFAAGTLLCLVKPHLSLLPLATLWLAKPTRVMAGKVATLAAFIAMFGVLSLLEGDLIRDYAEALRAHGESENAKLGAVDVLYGVPGILDRFGFSGGMAIMLGASALTFVIGLRWLPRLTDRAKPDDIPDMIVVAALVGGIALVPIKGYDLAAVVPVFALLARASWPVQLMCAVPLLLLWRPRLATIIGASPDGTLTIVTLLLLAMASALLGHAIGMLISTRNRAGFSIEK